MSQATRGVLRLLLALVATFAAATAMLSWALQRERARGVQWADLDANERRALVESELGRLGSVYVPYEPDARIGYTFEPNSEVTAWGQTFQTNELGFRAASVAKRPGVFRVVFVGDSWVFGLGEKYADSFPGQFERLAHDTAGAERVEAWPLAIPGYNVMNQAAAIEVLGPSLEADLVVWCPTNNDISSAHQASVRGYLLRQDSGLAEPFGDGMYRDYSIRFIDSFRYLNRWRRAAELYGATGRWLQFHGIPVAFLFAARWEEGWPAALMAESSVEAPWAAVPESWNRDRNAFNHGTAASYALYARLAHRLVEAAMPDWPAGAGRISTETSEPSIRWGGVVPRGMVGEGLARARRDLVLESFRPAGGSESEGIDPCSGTMDCPRGRMGRRAAILLKRPPRAAALEIVLQGIEKAPVGLYPLKVEALIPSLSGGRAASVVLEPGEGSRVAMRLAYPVDVEPGGVFELELVAERAVLHPASGAIRSVDIVSIEPEP